MLVIGIGGGSGSGKSTITKYLSDKFGDDVTVIRHDDYYKEQHSMPFEERIKQNYDCPDAYDTELMAAHLRALRNGEAIDCPVYDYKEYDRSDSVKRIEPTKVLLIDGILILAEPKLRAVMDLKLYVDTDADIRILRRIRRDVNERRRTLDSVIDQYLLTVKPMHEAYVEPSTKFADIIIPEGGHNLVALEMVINFITNRIC